MTGSSVINLGNTGQGNGTVFVNECEQREATSFSAGDGKQRQQAIVSPRARTLSVGQFSLNMPMTLNIDCSSTSSPSPVRFHNDEFPSHIIHIL